VSSSASPIILKSRVIVAAGDRTLLFYTAPDVPSNPVRWLTPGGHLEAGETHLDGAVRELFEETGLVVEPEHLGSPVWARDFVGEPSPGVLRDYHEEYYLLRVDEAFDPIVDNWTPEEIVDVQAWRWFTLAELSSSDDAVEPDDLAAVLSRLLT
jgi:8-oxo-dGTP pyrophosphatase MutT (NUDIX family)